jgi:glucosamine kinase
MVPTMIQPSPPNATIPLRDRIAFFIGVDGGASGTRICIAGRDGRLVAKGTGGPSALGLGRDTAWRAILDTIHRTLAASGRKTADFSDCAIGLGLSGVHNKGWTAEFISKAPDFAAIKVDTDAFTTLLGAHRGKPGAIIALGTGSVAEVLHDNGHRQEVGGWGFPTADEASGCWLGMRALRHAEQVLDGRVAATPLSDAVINHCGRTRDGLMNWLAHANQTNYAELAPIVIAYAARDAVAGRIVQDAGDEIAKMAAALDPHGKYPLALCGGLGEPLRPYLPEALQQRLVRPAADSISRSPCTTTYGQTRIAKTGRH